MNFWIILKYMSFGLLFGTIFTSILVWIFGMISNAKALKKSAIRDRSQLPPIRLYREDYVGCYFFTPLLHTDLRGELFSFFNENRMNLHHARIRPDCMLWNFDPFLGLGEAAGLLREFGLDVLVEGVTNIPKSEKK
jgi:hypothetical protein